MKKHVLILAALLGITTMFSCNAQKRVDASELAEAMGFDSMTENTDFIVTGELTNDMLKKIGVAIENGFYKVGLDLSKTTGLTEIRNYAFENCEGLTSITIPDSVTQIGESAFSGCEGLTSITIPDSVTKIGESAFENCKGLTSITIPDSVTQIGKSAFYRCEGLTSIEIPDSVTQIGGIEFSFCTRLEKITVSKGNKVYDSRNNCNAIISTEDNTLLGGCKNTVIPDSVTQIGDYAFYGCEGLASITIPDSVTQIGESAFSGCEGLTSIEIPDSVTKIENYAFENCKGLTSITIPDSVTTIEGGAFSHCTGLEKITVSKGNKVYDSRNNCNAIIRTENNLLIAGCKNTVIPDSVTQIRFDAFNGCTGLASITIPDSVTKIENYAFYGCANLKTINASERVKEMVRKAM